VVELKASVGVAPRVRGAVGRVLTWIPSGGSLPETSWRDRHRAVVVLLWLHAVGIALFGLLAGYEPLHSLTEGAAIAATAAMASWPRASRAARAGVATFGLVLSSALLVHVSGGYVEFHFHFFVMVIVVSLYEDWIPFLLAVLFVVLEHGVIGVLVPMAVYNHPDAWAHPWKWAAIHGVFVLAASAASITAWRLNEIVRSRYHLILDSAGDGIYGLDRRGRITFVNAAAARMLDRSPIRLVGRFEQAALTLVGPGQPGADATGSPGQATLADGTAHGAAGAELRRADGATLYVDYVSTPVRERGDLVGVVVAFQDVTERRRAEDALRESEERLRQSQKMEAVGQLAGGVAHDFNNLMTVVIGFSELVLSQPSSTEVDRRYVEQIARAGERATDLTRQLLAFSRQQVLEPEILELNEAVASTEQMLARVIGEDVELVTELEPSSGRVRADRGQIGQVILNLAVNARDAMPRGGRLRIATREVELTTPIAGTHGTLRPGSYTVLEVSDTGTGMDEATQARIFDPFFTTKERGKGTGLGLSTVYGIIAQSGGQLRVESAPGRGTTFRIYLPRVAATEAEGPAAEREAASAPHSLGGHETILLVEDEEDVRRLVQHVLQDSGYVVLAAGNVEEALRVASGRPGSIDLLLTDVVMPGLSGPDLAERLRATQPSAAVLYMSGYTDHEAVHQAASGGGHAFLQKPFKPDLLVRSVRQRLDGRLSSHQARAAALAAAEREPGRGAAQVGSPR
jgi:PAS domain S-box-containing protein